jgi:hypothetical protein
MAIVTSKTRPVDLHAKNRDRPHPGRQGGTRPFSQATTRRSAGMVAGPLGGFQAPRYRQAHHAADRCGCGSPPQTRKKTNRVLSHDPGCVGHECDRLRALGPYRAGGIRLVARSCRKRMAASATVTASPGLFTSHSRTIAVSASQFVRSSDFL